MEEKQEAMENETKNLIENYEDQIKEHCSQQARLNSLLDELNFRYEGYDDQITNLQVFLFMFIFCEMC